MKPLPIFFVLIGLIGIIPMSWQNCVQIVLYLVVFEGAIRKWVVPGAADLVYFIKDFLMIAAYIKFYCQPPEERINFVKAPLLKSVLLLASIIPIFQIFNPKLNTIFLGLFGIKGYLLYTPMIFLLPSFFRTKEDFISFMRNYLIITFGICCLALVQYVSPGDSFINRYASEDAKYISTMGISNNVRATGTFPYITGFTVYLTFCFGFILPLMTYPQSAKKHFLNLVILLFMLGGFLVAGSRGPLFHALILLVLYIVLNKNLWGKGSFKKFFLPIIFIGLIIPSLFSSQLTNFISRTTKNQDGTERLKWLYSTVLENVTDMGIFGYGTGSAGASESKIRKIFGITDKRPFKSNYDIESGNIMLELGLLGFALWYFMRLYLIIALWKTFIRLQTGILKDYALIACLLHLLSYNGTTGSLVHNVTFQVYYWFTASFILLLPQLDRLEVERAKRLHYQRLHHEKIYRSMAINTKELR